MPKKYGKKAQEAVKSAMRKLKKGELKIGKSVKKVKNPKQAAAIGLSEARKKGAKTPPQPKRKSKTPKKQSAPKRKTSRK